MGLFGLLFFGLVTLMTTTAGQIAYGTLVVALGAGAVLQHRSRRNAAARRLQDLLEKYEDSEIVERMIAGTIWQGETEEQVIESLGSPQEVEEKVLKTKTKRVLKYGHTGANRYRTRITIDDGEVVGWETK